MILVFGGMLLAACTAQNPTAQATPSTPATVTPVQAGNQITVDGRVVPARTAQLTFAATGAVSDVLVVEGDQVAAGAVLARLDSAQQDAAVDQAEANLAGAEAALAQLNAQPYPEDVAAAEAALADAQAKQARLDENGGLRKEKDAAAAAVKQAQTQLDVLNAGPRSEARAAAQADVDAAKAALAQARAALAETELRAPFAGTVAFLDLEAGEVPAPGMPVMRLADMSTWQIETENLTELNIVNLAQGDRASVRFDAIPGLQLAGTVAHIGSYGDNRQGDIVYRVVIALDQQDQQLRWNMTAAVTVEPQ